MSGGEAVMPVDVANRADMELGAAWRRCESGVPQGHFLTLHAATEVLPYTAVCHDNADGRLLGTGDTAAAALDALAEALASHA